MNYNLPTMEPVAKKLCTNADGKLEINKVEETKNGANIDDNGVAELDTFDNFKVERILNNVEEKCSVVFEAKHLKSSEKAVIHLQKLPFSNERLDEIFSKLENPRTLFKNDVYHNLLAQLPLDLNEIKVHTVFPADEKHIKQHERHPGSFINETPELYKSVTLPFIESLSYSKQWIYNVLEHKKEADRIVCEDLDPEIGFILVPDMKWTGEQVENLYLQALVMRRDILSIRDLRKDHLPLLRNVYDKCTKVIQEKYKVPSSKLRIYFHYQPSFYHLHIHFSALSFEAPGIWAGKAHLLKEVISNIETDSEFYQKATLAFTIKDNQPLKAMYDQHGYFTEN